MRGMKEVVKLVCGYLNKENIEYVLVGGLAVIMYGEPRMTMDLDIVLKIPEDKIEELVGFLKNNDFFADKEDIEMAFEEKSHCTVQDKNSAIRLDIKGVYGERELESINDKIAFDYEGEKIYLASLEDTIANKLLFGREHDIKDAEGIYARQLKNLDTKKLEQKCKKLGVYEEFTNMKKRVEKYLEEIGE